MTAFVYAALSLLLGCGALVAMWEAINGARDRNWKFVGFTLFICLIFAGGSLNMYECSQGRCVPDDPTVPRLR